jgi:hypothetical protein
MLSTKQHDELLHRLGRISALSLEIEEVPNLPQDVWTMGKVTKKAREIHEHAKWITETLDGQGGTGTGAG